MMSQNPSELPAAQGDVSLASSSSAATDDVIDLRVYLNVLFRWWKEILLIAVLFGVIVGGVYYLLYTSRERLYAASADAAIVRTTSEVTLDERFVTTAENPTATAAASRRNALIAMAESLAIAQAVIDELGDILPDDLQRPGALVDVVQAQMATANGRSGDSDLIRITATTNDATLSAQIATSWAKAYVQDVNQIFGQVPDALFESIAVEQETSRISYESAQRAYEEFLASSRVDELSRLISDKETVVNLLRTGRSNLLTQLVDSAVAARADVASAIGDAQAQNLVAPIVAEQEGKRDLVQAYVDAIYQGQASVISRQGERDRQLLQNYYTRWLQVDSALGEAQTLRDQTRALAGEEETVGSGSSSLALSLLKLQAFTSALDASVTQDLSMDTQLADATTNNASDTQAAAPGLLQSSQPVQVQVGATPLQIRLSDVTTMSNAQIIGELDALIAALTTRRDELQEQITTLSAAILKASNIELAATTPQESAVAASLPTLVDAILGSSLITSTTSSLEAASAWEIGDLTALYNTADLQGLVLAGDADDSLSQTIAAVEAELRALKSELEAERTTQTELTEARDLAQDAYRAANSKKTELTLARAGAGGELRFAAPAIAPLHPVGGVSPVLVTLAATFAGFVAAVIIAFVADAMGNRPFLTQRRTSRTSTPA